VSFVRSAGRRAGIQDSFLCAWNPGSVFGSHPCNQPCCTPFTAFSCFPCAGWHVIYPSSNRGARRERTLFRYPTPWSISQLGQTEPYYARTHADAQSAYCPHPQTIKTAHARAFMSSALPIRSVLRIYIHRIPRLRPSGSSDLYACVPFFRWVSWTRIRAPGERIVVSHPISQYRRCDNLHLILSRLLILTSLG
jgi:hypothetical protein